MSALRSTRFRRARLVPIAITTAALSSALIGASVTGTLSAFNASITNSSNTAATGSLVMQETGPSGNVTCLSSSGTNNNFANCDTINKYGGTSSPFTPGTTHAVSVTIANTGSVAVGSFTLKPGTCTKSNLNNTSNSGNLCDSLVLTLTCAPVSGGAPSTIYSSRSLSSIASDASPATIPSACVPGTNGAAPIQFSFSLTLPTSADSSVQSQQVSQPLTWTFTGA